MHTSAESLPGFGKFGFGCVGSGRNSISWWFELKIGRWNELSLIVSYCVSGDAERDGSQQLTMAKEVAASRTPNRERLT